MRLVLLRRKDLRATEIVGQGSPQVRIFEWTQILCLGGIRCPNLPRLHGELCLSQPPAIEKVVVCFLSVPAHLVLIVKQRLTGRRSALRNEMVSPGR